MQENLKQQIVAGMLQYQSDRELSNAAFAKLVPMNASYMTYLTSGKWNEVPAGGKNTQISDKYFYEIARLIGLDLEESYWQHFDTDNFNRCYNTLTSARKETCF